MRKDRNTDDLRDAISSDLFKKAVKTTKKRAASRKPLTSKENVPLTRSDLEANLHVSNWSADGWLSFLSGQLNEFEVPSSWKDFKNKGRRMAALRDFRNVSVKELGSEAALVIAIANLSVSWHDGDDFPYYWQVPTEFNLNYIQKAWNSYKKAVQKNPLSLTRCFQESDSLTSRLKLYVGKDNIAPWTSSQRSDEQDSLLRTERQKASAAEQKKEHLKSSVDELLE